MAYFSLTINNLSIGEEAFLIFDTESGFKLLKEVTAAGNVSIRYYWDITDASPTAEFTNLATTITVNGTLLTVASGTNFSFLAQKEGHPIRIYNGISYEWCTLNRYISSTQILVNKVITNTGQVSTPTFFPNNSTQTIIGKVTRETNLIYTIDAYYDTVANKNVQIEYLSALPSISDVANFEGRTVLLSTDGYIYTYKNNVWVLGKSAEVISSPTAPVSPTLGSLWFRTTDSRMFYWNGTQWVQTVTGSTGTRSVNITVTTGIYDGETVIHTLDNNLYRWNASTTSWILVVDGTRMDLSNENHTVSANSDGSSPVLTGANTLISVYSGDANVTSLWTITATPSAGVTGSLTDSAPNKLYTVTGFTTDTGYVDFTATRAGFANRTARFSLSKSKAGTAGAGTVYQITPNVGAVREVSGVFTPSDITYSATSTTGTNTPVVYSGRFKIYTSTDGVNFTLQSSSTTDESSRSYTIPAGVKFLKGELYLAGGFTSLLDLETVPTVKDGADGSSGSTAIRLDLNNETQSIPVVNGSPVLTYATTNIKIYEGVTDATASWNITATPSAGVTGTLTGNGTANVSYAVSTFTVNSGTVTFTATRSGYATLTGVFTLSKVYSANFYYVSPSVEAIRKNTSGTLIPATITFSSFSVDGNSTPAAYAGRFIISTSTDGTSFNTQYTSATNESSKAYTIPVGVIAVRVALYLAGGTTTLLDTETVLVLEDGLNGTNGVDGVKTAIVYIYKRDSISPALPSATTTYDFNTKTLTGLNNGWSTTIPGGLLPLYVSAATAATTGTSDTITSGEWSSAVILSQNGNDGTNGLNSATVFLFKRTSSATPPAVPSTTTTYTFSSSILSGTLDGWTQTLPNTGGIYRWMTTATAASTTSTDTITTAEWATPNILAQDGVSGGLGANAISVNLSKTAITLFAYADGTVPDFSGATGNVTVFSGSTDVTLASSYSSSASGCTGSINGSGVYSITAMSQDTATFTITVVYDGVSYVRVVALSKVKTGYEIVGTLPSTNLFQGRMVFLTTDNKLYRYTGAAWTTAVPTADLSGYILQGQLGADSVVANNILAGAIVAGKIATDAITANNIQTGAVTAAKISVTSLSAMNANTGNLSVNGTLTLGSSGKIITSGTAYNGNGIFLGDDSGTYKFSVGGTAGKLTFDGTSLSIPGNLLVGSSVPNSALAGGITADKLTVTNLQAVNANTGNLSVNGTLTLGSSGKIITSGTGYNGNGIFLGDDSGTYKFSIGSGANKLTFDGTNLSIPGNYLVNGSVANASLAGGITADKLTVTSLSAITATIGTLRTATTGARVEITDNLIRVYDSSNTLRVRLGIW